MESMGKNYSGEQILVITRALLDSLGTFQGATTDIDRYLPALMDEGNSTFMDRALAEEDPSHKQLIPYCIFRHGDKILHYLRGKSGGEARLYAQGSIGIGGHINPIDQTTTVGGASTYQAAVTREIEEELVVGGSYTNEIIGLINDDSNAVGQVHLGVVHLITLESEDVRANEDCLIDLTLTPIADLKGEKHDKLESWSQYALTLLPA